MARQLKTARGAARTTPTYEAVLVRSLTDAEFDLLPSGWRREACLRGRRRYTWEEWSMRRTWIELAHSNRGRHGFGA